MCRTHEIAKELDVTLLKRLYGAQVLDLPEQEPLPDGVYLVERDGEKFVLKTGRINKNEIDDNWKLADIGIETRTIIEAMPEEYILYEYIDYPVLGTTDFWKDDKMQLVFETHKVIEYGLNREPITGEEASTLIDWIEERPAKVWLDQTLDSPWTQEEVAEFREIITKHRDLWAEPSKMRRMYYDANGDNYLINKDQLIALDADIVTVPHGYSDMRYLAWVVLKMPPDKVSLDWIRKWVETLGRDREHLFTFLVSMLGIMWDMHGNERFKGENIEKTEIVKQTIYWLKDELKKEETNE